MNSSSAVADRAQVFRMRGPDPVPRPNVERAFQIGTPLFPRSVWASRCSLAHMLTLLLYWTRMEKKPRATRIKITERALFQRVNRKLKQDGQKLCTAHTESARQQLGRFYVVQTGEDAGTKRAVSSGVGPPCSAPR